jgi:hypothetical protein
MGIEAKFDVREVVRRLTEESERRVRAEVLEILSRVGETAVNMAKKHHEGNYMDRSGDLRASLGYVIAKDGEIVFSGGFDPGAAPNGTDGEAGAKEGRRFAEEIAGRYDRGYVLVLVAGMYYGAYLEDREYNVIKFTQMEADRKADELFRKVFSVKN